MILRRINWPLWVGLLLTIASFSSFFFIFVRFPITRDFPWANFVLFAIAAVLLFLGLRRGFAPDRPHPLRSKIVSVLVTVVGVLVIGLFAFAYFVGGRMLPASKGAPQVGQRAPEFTLPDSTGKQVSLNELMTSPINGKAPRGVLLIFYRGYW